MGEVLARNGATLVSALARQFRDIEAAQDALQEAAARALERWPVRGVPDRPAAWLFTVARNQLLDEARRGPVEAPEPVSEPRADDRLALLFAVCHPAIAPRTQVSLALRTLCGLSVAQVARAFLEAPEATGRRLSRASQKIRDAGIPFEVPGPRHRAERVAAVLAAIYLLFNEGYAPTQGAAVRAAVCADAIGLAAQVQDLLPEEPEVGGLHALMCLHHARRDARVDDQGRAVPLDDQDRGRWHHREIEHATALLDRALRAARPGPYQIQAAIAALHATAPSPEDTDWVQITALYGALLQHVPSPVVELNAAVALAMSAGPARGLARLDDLLARKVLDDYALLHASRAHLLEELGRNAEATDAWDAALAACTSETDRTLIMDRRSARQAPRRRRRRTVTEGPAPRLPERDWRRVAPLLRSKPRGRGRRPRPARQMLEAILWVLGTGQPWRALPPEFGPWQTVYHRFRQWETDGTLLAITERLARRPSGRVMAARPAPTHSEL